MLTRKSPHPPQGTANTLHRISLRLGHWATGPLLVFYNEDNKDKTQQLAQHRGQGQLRILPDVREIRIFFVSLKQAWSMTNSETH